MKTFNIIKDSRNIGKWIFLVSYIFVVSPFLIFVSGYLKIWLAIPVVIIVLLSLYFTIKDIPTIEISFPHKKQIFQISVILFILFIWVLLSGIGKIAWQNSDHIYRNAIYEALVNNPWPVGHGYLKENSADVGMLVYYIGFWMVPAVFGKLFGVEAGYLFQVFWAFLGLALLYALICIWRKKLSVWPLIIFIFFSGLDIIFNNLFTGWSGRLFSTDFLEFAGGNYCYSSINVCVSAVFNQSIIAWLVVMLLLLQKTHKSIVFLLACTMLSASFPFVGMIPLVIYWAFSKYQGNSDLKGATWIKRSGSFLRSITTFQNLVGGGCTGIITFLYLKVNNSVQNVQPVLNKTVPTSNLIESKTVAVSELFTLQDFLDNSFVLYLGFILLKVGIYFIFVYKKQKTQPLYYIILVSLLLIPFIKVGNFVDFCMRASIPAIFLLYLYVIDYLATHKKNFAYGLMCVTLLLSSASAFHEMGRAIINWDQARRVSARIETVCSAGNFGGNKDSFFFRKLCKPLLRKKLDIEIIKYCDFEKDEFYVVGPEFRTENNSLVASEMNIEMDRYVLGDVWFEDGGMLDDNSVQYTLIVNGHFVGTLHYDSKQIVIPQEYFNEYAQCIQIRINQEVKLYSEDCFRMSPLY